MGGVAGQFNRWYLREEGQKHRCSATTARGARCKIGARFDLGVTVCLQHRRQGRPFDGHEELWPGIATVS